MLTDESIKIMGKDDPLVPPLDGKVRDAAHGRSRAKRASCTNCRQSKVSEGLEQARSKQLMLLDKMQCRRSVSSTLLELSKAAQRV